MCLPPRAPAFWFSSFLAHGRIAFPLSLELKFTVTLRLALVCDMGAEITRQSIVTALGAGVWFTSGTNEDTPGAEVPPTCVLR